MPCVGFILRPQKRPRVLTAALAAAAAARGVSLVALDPGSTPEQWREAGVDVLVHKVPDEPGLDERLDSWAAAAAATAGDMGISKGSAVLLDQPSAVRRLQDREEMLAPLAGEPLTFARQDSATRQGTAHRVSTVRVTIPKQTVLQPGCSMDSALQQLATDGLQFPLLVKPLVSAATDSVRPPGAAAVDGERSAAPPAAASATANDGHTLGVIFTDEALRALLEDQQQQQQQHQQHQQEEELDHCPAQQQQQQQQCVISLPAVLQQYVPHQALYKLYVIGPSCVLTRRNTINPAILESAAAAAAPLGKQGFVILPRLSADKLAAVAAAKQQRQQQQQLAASEAQPSSASIVQSHNSSSSIPGGSSSSSVGTALADDSVINDPLAPPLWAMQQLAAHLRKGLSMNLFNVDIIAPSCDSGGEPCDSDASQGGQQQEQQQQQQWVVQQLLVVDINYFPGYDKVAGAEELFADFLAQCAGGQASM